MTSLYFGGGTPALAVSRIQEIISAVREHFIITEGIGLELHPDNVTLDILQSLKADIDKAFLLGANHIAIYPLIDFTFTSSSVTSMPQKEKRKL